MSMECPVHKVPSRKDPSGWNVHSVVVDKRHKAIKLIELRHLWSGTNVETWGSYQALTGNSTPTGGKWVRKKFESALKDLNNRQEGKEVK